MHGREIVAACQGFRWLQGENRYEVKYLPVSDYILDNRGARPEDCYHLPKMDEFAALEQERDALLDFARAAQPKADDD